MQIPDPLIAPRAHGGAAGRASLREQPEDFVVREQLSFRPEGEGEHVLLRVRKRSANTLWVAKQLARLAKVHPKEIGFAGMKDRDAVAEQCFSAPLRSARGDQWIGVAGEGFEVLAQERCRRKLKRGALRGNEFEIVLRNFSGDAALLEERLHTLAGLGAPNYFGPQRFGREGGNLRRALEWFGGGAAPQERVDRGFALSAARAAIFNGVLAERVRTGGWNVLLPGDVANLEGTGSIFAVESVDDTLAERCAKMDVHPTGPLWGAGDAGTRAAIAQLEQVCAERYGPLRSGLASAGVEFERRALRVVTRDLQWSIEAGVVQLRFSLNRGAFATAVLHELIDNAFEQQAPEGDG